MKITFYGAAGEVTGSKHLIEANGRKILLDCGLFQGHLHETYERNKELPFKAEELDAVILSHAHIDHSGSLPTLARQGFKGPIYCTFATQDATAWLLKDSAHLQEADALYLNRDLEPGEPTYIPIHTISDAEKAIAQMIGYNYGQWFQVTPDIRAYFYDAGHILGSAVILLEITEGDKKTRLVYTGDLGRKNLPILKDPEVIDSDIDIVITESTYGNRLHEMISGTKEKMEEIINRVAHRGGKLIIPAFAMERTQEVIYILHELHHEGKIPPIPIYVDSPLSSHLTAIFRAHPECYDQETVKEFIEDCGNPFSFASLRYVETTEESKALNNKIGPFILIASSGMCNGGRILHHLRNNVEDHRNIFLAVGYMVRGTLGRDIVDGLKEIRIFHEKHRVNCEVEIIDSLSGHADYNGIMDYLSHMKNVKNFFTVHGDSEALVANYNRIKETYPQANVFTPEPKQSFEF